MDLQSLQLTSRTTLLEIEILIRPNIVGVSPHSIEFNTRHRHGVVQTRLQTAYLILERRVEEELLQHPLPQFSAGLVAHKVKDQHLSLEEMSVLNHRQHSHPELVLQAPALVHLGEHHERVVALVTGVPYPGPRSLAASSYFASVLLAWLLHSGRVGEPGVGGQVSVISVAVVAGLGLLDPLGGTGEVLPL